MRATNGFQSEEMSLERREESTRVDIREMKGLVGDIEE